MYGKGAMTDRMCQKWFIKFHAADLSLDSMVGRPVEVDGNQIETLIENNQYYTLRKITDILKISNQ